MVTTSRGRELRPVRNLHQQLADSLRDRLRDGEWQAGEKLPTEAQLSAEYGVSRSTVRGALQLLETQGRTRTRHGLGTFVAPFAAGIRTSLQELQSMSEIIRVHGHDPQMDYHSARVRPATAREAEQLGLAPDEQVFATERAVLADGEVVAFSYDAIQMSLLGEGFDPVEVTGSLFELLRRHQVVPTTAVTELHAVADPSIGWEPRPGDGVYLLLDQVHYTDDGLATLASRTYFLEGRFQFSVLRVR